MQEQPDMQVQTASRPVQTPSEAVAEAGAEADARLEPEEEAKEEGDYRLQTLESVAQPEP